MKIALAQVNPLVGDIVGNTQKILKGIGLAKKQGADLVIFPEMALWGYPPRDLLEIPHLISKNEEAVRLIAEATQGIAVVLGAVYSHPEKKTKPLSNAAFWLEAGKIRQVFYKSRLPFYDVFDETRYFEPGSSFQTLDFGGEVFGVSICEDIWVEPFAEKNTAYPVNPIEKLAALGSRILINISASPYSMGKFEARRNMLEGVAQRYGQTVIYVNQVGGNDELIFDGGSMVVDPQGKMRARAPFFKEGLTLVDLFNSPQPPLMLRARESELDLLSEALITGLRDYVKKCGFTKVALGLSGGIDSALVAFLAVKALGSKNVTGVMMPSRYTSTESLKDARALAKNLKIKFKEIPITPLQKEFEKSFKKIFGKKKADITEENIQARIRGNLLMALSNKEGHLILSTGNKSELAVGYSTLYGDMCGGLSVIADMPKTLVYRLARFLNRKKIIPENIFTKAPTAELRFNQTDQDSLPPYEELDAIIKAYVEELKSREEIISQGFKPQIVNRVISMIHRNEYKRRQAAPGLKVTAKAFGMGRRFPIACKF